MDKVSESLIERILDKVTGPFGALIIALVSLWWLATKFEMFITDTMNQHAEDRELYKSSIKQMTDQLVVNSGKIDSIQEDVRNLAEDMKELKKEE